MIIDTDFHSHVSRSSAAQMIETAQQKGLRVLGLSEHVFQMEEARPLLKHLGPEGPLLTFATYIEDVHTAAKQSDFDARWLRYFELLRATVSSGYFSLVSHPGRMRVSNPHLPPTFDEELDRLAAEATRNDVALEINGYDVLNYKSLVRRLAKACVSHRTPISVGSDAHIPRRIAQAHHETEDLLREVEITKVRIWRRMAEEEYSI